MSTPTAGQYLYSTCAAEDYGRILAVGQDDNDVPTIDIELTSPDDAFSCDEDPEFPAPPLTRVELPPGTKVILRHVQYRWLGEGEDRSIVCNTPGNGCFRCTKLFRVHDVPAEEYLRS